MIYCHKCLRKIHFWESREEGCHIKCLPIKERCKSYHIQRDMYTTFLVALFIVTIMIISTDSILINFVAVVIGIFTFLFGNIIAFGIRKREEEEEEKHE